MSTRQHKVLSSLQSKQYVHFLANQQIFYSFSPSKIFLHLLRNDYSLYSSRIHSSNQGWTSKSIGSIPRCVVLQLVVLDAMIWVAIWQCIFASFCPLSSASPTYHGVLGNEQLACAPFPSSSCCRMGRLLIGYPAALVPTIHRPPWSVAIATYPL